MTQPSNMQISQATIGSGAVGEAYTDGDSVDAGGGLFNEVTITNTNPTTASSEIALLWVPHDSAGAKVDVDAETELAAAGAHSATFRGTAGIYGSYRIRIREVVAGQNVDEIRIFGIKSPLTGVLPPALNERANPAASLENAGAAEIADSENNEGGVFDGWRKFQRKVTEALEVLSGVSGAATLWINPVQVRELVGNATIATIDGLSPTAGDAYVATDAGTPSAGSSDALTAGDITEYDGANWNKILDAVGGFPPNGTRALLSVQTALIAPYTDGAQDGLAVDFDGTTLTGSNTAEVFDGVAVLINGENGLFENQSYIFDGAIPSGLWVQFSNQQPSFGTPVGLGVANDAGSGSDSARSNHVHRRELVQTSKKTTTYTMVAGDLVPYDTVAVGPFTITFPAGPANGDRVAVSEDVSGGAALTLAGNGNQIQNPATDTFGSSFAIAIPNTSIEWVYNGTRWKLAGNYELPQIPNTVETGTSYTLENKDNGRLVTLDNAGAIALTVPNGLTPNFSCLVMQKGAGQVTAAGGATLQNPDSELATRLQWSVISILPYGTDTYVVGGDTA